MLQLEYSHDAFTILINDDILKIHQDHEIVKILMVVC